MATISNIVIDQGTTFSLELNLTNDDTTAKDLTAYTVTSQLRKSYESTSATDFTNPSPSLYTPSLLSLLL